MPADGKIVLYHRYLHYEWGTSYWFASLPGSPDSVAEALVDAESYMAHVAVEFNRWEAFDHGVAAGDGAISPVVTGQYLGDLLDIRYCGYWLFASSGPKASSSKYLHGIDETMQTGGVPSAALLTSLGIYSAAIVAAGVTDSDGFAVTGVSFGHWTRRRKLRRLP